MNHVSNFLKSRWVTLALQGALFVLQAGVAGASGDKLTIYNGAIALVQLALHQAARQMPAPSPAQPTQPTAQKQ